MQKYLIDGNNLIGKIKDLWNLQNTDKQMSRIKLVKMLDEYFNQKSVKVSLHFDGFSADAIPSSKIKIHYSNSKTADSKIKHEIDNSKNPKLITVISSDHSVQNFARVNSCTIIKSEDFAKQLKIKKKKISEDEIAKTISNDEMLKLFEKK